MPGSTPSMPLLVRPKLWSVTHPFSTGTSSASGGRARHQLVLGSQLSALPLLLCLAPSPQHLQRLGLAPVLRPLVLQQRVAAPGRHDGHARLTCSVLHAAAAAAGTAAPQQPPGQAANRTWTATARPVGQGSDVHGTVCGVEVLPARVARGGQAGMQGGTCWRGLHAVCRQAMQLEDCPLAAAAQRLADLTTQQQQHR